MVRVDTHGGLSVRSPLQGEVRSIRTLHVLVYRASIERLVRVDIPVWFLKIKAPALRFLMRDTGLDLQEFGITLRELQRHGPCIVLDETSANGDRIFLWTEE